MTTEIAVINRLGVALAADSAVTISGFDVEKVFDTGDKLFELSCDYPIAIMVNGNLDFLGVPWEVIIKDFRRETVDGSEMTMRAWAIRFLEFVYQHRAVNEEQAALWLARAIQTEQGEIAEEIGAAFAELIRTADGGDALAALRERIGAILRGRATRYAETDRIASLEALGQEEVVGLVEPHLGRVATQIFRNFEPTEQELESLRAVLIGRLLTNVSTEYNTGLVFSGFGGDDLFPSLYSVVLDGVLAGRLRYNIAHNVEVTRRGGGEDGTTKELGTALSFAQTDVITRLLRGADERFVDNSRRFIRNTVAEAIPQIFEQLSFAISAEDGAAVDTGTIATFLADTIAARYETAAQEIGDTIEQEFKQTIALMPKQELIELAEALVGITAVERKASYDAGTVGGPIDVALITRSEGFVWVKRKHHFKADMNFRYLAKVFGFHPRQGETA